MPYTTQGYMTPADMADLADLYDWNAGEQEAAAEEEAMEKAHVEHVDNCRECQEDISQRETGARVALAMDDARRALEKAIQEALVGRGQMPRQCWEALERGLAEARAALRKI